MPATIQPQRPPIQIAPQLTKLPTAPPRPPAPEPPGAAVPWLPAVRPAAPPARQGGRAEAKPR
ncbi:MAG: hypothetical protein EHM77_01450, partial [Planctomycetaceae bacterium]